MQKEMFVANAVIVTDNFSPSIVSQIWLVRHNLDDRFISSPPVVFVDKDEADAKSVRKVVVDFQTKLVLVDGGDVWFRKEFLVSGAGRCMSSDKDGPFSKL